MRRSFFKSHFRPALVARALAATIFAGVAVSAVAQQPPFKSVQIQRAAMRKLAFLAGRWSGPVPVHLGPGEALHLTQHEDVEFKLDGLVLPSVEMLLKRKR